MKSVISICIVLSCLLLVDYGLSADSSDINAESGTESIEIEAASGVESAPPDIEQVSPTPYSVCADLCAKKYSECYAQGTFTDDTCDAHYQQCIDICSREYGE